MLIQEGDFVERLSYGRDIIFIVDKIIKSDNIAVLKGLTIRIKADALLSDLVHVNKEKIDNSVKILDDKIENCVKRHKQENMLKRKYENNGFIYTGKILHLDGDRRYTDKSVKYYKQLGLNAVVKNIPEDKQASYVKELLIRYNPDILVITGHDSMIKKGKDYNKICNYRNSKHFINTVKEARHWGKTSEDLVIFAGACQSFYEAIMLAGADFASSPGRILIDFVDPLIVAEKVATTDANKYVTITQIIEELKEGRNGIGGVGVKGKKRIVT